MISTIFGTTFSKGCIEKKAPKKEVKAPKKRSIVSEKKKYSLRKKEKSPKKRSIDSEKEWKKESTSSGIRTHEAYATDLKSVPFDRSGILVVCL